MHGRPAILTQNGITLCIRVTKNTVCMMDIKEAFDEVWKNEFGTKLKSKVVSLLKVIFLASELPSLGINQGCNLRTASDPSPISASVPKDLFLDNFCLSLYWWSCWRPWKQVVHTTHTSWWFPCTDKICKWEWFNRCKLEQIHWQGEKRLVTGRWHL